MVPRREDKHPNHGKKWTEEDIEKLIKTVEKYNMGNTTSWKGFRIASEKLKRKKSACRRKYREETGSSHYIEGTMDEPIKINKWASFRQCYGETQHCSYCGQSINNQYGLSIVKDSRKSDDVETDRNYNVWLHPRCIEPFLETIKDAFQEHKELLEEKKVENLAKGFKA